MRRHQIALIWFALARFKDGGRKKFQKISDVDDRSKRAAFSLNNFDKAPARCMLLQDNAELYT